MTIWTVIRPVARALGILTALLVIGAMGVARAQQPGASPVSASVDRTVLTTDDLLTLVIRVSDSSGRMPQPDIPPMPEFRITGTTMSSQMSIVNGAVMAETDYLYYLQPAQAGTLTIPPIGVTLNGQTYYTQPITVEVSQGAGQTQTRGTGTRLQPQSPSVSRDDRMFVEALVDNNRPYVGEQVLYKFRFYQAVLLGGQPSYEPPAFTGFWNNAQQTQTEYMTTVGSTRYRVTELTHILFPTNAGRATIGPAKLTVPGGFFDPNDLLETNPVELDVLPLPDGAPATFGGAVGQYSLTARTDTVEVGSGDASVQFHLILTGSGNIEALPDPVLPEMDDWRVYEVGTTTNAGMQVGVYGGSREYTYELVPTREGAVTIPSVSYTYFDPVAEEYMTTSTEPITINVAPGAAQVPASDPSSLAAPTLAAPTPEPTPAPVQLMRPNKPTPNVLIAQPPSVAGQPLFWALWAVPALALLGDFVLQRRERHLLEHADEIRSSRALRQARKALAQARRAADSDSYSACARILTTYISDKIHQPVAGLTRTALARLLESRGIPVSLVERVDSCLVATEAGRFSQDGRMNVKALLNETERLIKELDKELAT